MFRLGFVLVIFISGCVFGSISDFSEADIKGSQNEIYNSSFEIISEQDEYELPGWILLDNSESFVSIVNSDFNSGQYSLKISKPNQKINLVSDSFPIDPESVYFNRLFVKTNYKSNHFIEIQFVAFDANGKKINDFETKYYPDDIWTKATLTTGFFKQNVRFARIIITIPARDDKVFWLDDIESYKVYKIQK
ncbi:MAG: hypothetical protein K9N09_07135 [Candidatus Cloacimonetes bacterium]|nr:hypothetical protein [Candidatus Cloacimonadota bacterium]MCF7814252.1 hypothetical protein [Candidatus Cloacimonadota bacterium]MCF7868459.1 hypothetical protein [Candidatus Cloacimonadota bacterium]MCF7883921.1 hypothetical protein [Candidatus Cloacimonadota bacterium]